MSSNPLTAVIFMGVSVGIGAYTFRPILEQDKRKRITDTQPAAIGEPVAVPEQNDVPVVSDEQQPGDIIANQPAAPIVSSTKFFDRKKFWS